MNEYTVRNLQLMRDDTIVAVFMPGITPDMAATVAFCLNLGGDVMMHLVECEDGGPTLEDVVFERVSLGIGNADPDPIWKQFCAAVAAWRAWT